MKTRSAVVYSVLRLLAFVVPFAVMMLFPIFQQLYWLAAIFAALIGLSLSVLFLRRPLSEATAGLAERRQERAADLRAARRSSRSGAERDADEEDAAADAASESSASPEK